MFVRCFSVLLRLSCRGAIAGLALAFTGTTSGQTRFPGPIRSDDEVRRENRSILDEHPLTARPPDNNLQPKRIFFPPNPPPLGVSIYDPEDRVIVTEGPEAMAQFVGEPFYAPLSTFISPVVTGYQGGETLSDDDRTRVKNFLRERDPLLAELRETITTLTFADANTRLREFIALAERQTPRLIALEKDAEALRARFARKANWNELREWRLAGRQPERAAGPALLLELQVMRAAAFYFDGLSPAQRRLLREIAMELEEQAFVRTDRRPTAQLFIFFLPETARIPQPAGLPETAQRLLRAFIDEKGRMKEDLRQIVFAADRDRSTRDIKALADAQAPRFIELEETAEDLRAALARAPGFTRTPAPAALPRQLAERIEAYLAARRDIVDRTGRADDESLQPLQAELEALHGVIALQPGVALQEGLAVDAFLTTFLKQRREASAYYEYDIAVLEPGLSPEQRRLLFSGALASLQLPLPGSEEQPTSAPGMLLR